MTHPASPPLPSPWSRVHFGLRLKEARLAAGLNQAAVAMSCGRKGNGWISQLEDGAFPRDFEDVLKLAAALKVSPTWLVTGIRSAEDLVAVDATPLAVIGRRKGGIKSLHPHEIPHLVGATAEHHFLLWGESLANPNEAPIQNGLLVCETKKRQIPGGMPSVTQGEHGSYSYEAAAKRAAPGRIGHVVVAIFAAPRKRLPPASRK